MGETNGVNQKVSSTGLNFGVMLNKELVSKNDTDLLFGFGLRYAINTFRNNRFLSVVDSIQATQLNVYDALISRSSYSLSSRFVELPSELRLRHYGNEGVIRFSLGALIGARERIVERARIEASPYVQDAYPDANTFRYGVFIRLGIKSIAVYAGYYLNPIFKSPSSSKLNILNLGINLAL